MGKFTEIAKKTTSLSTIMIGRNKIKTEAIASRFPEGITLTDFDVIKTTKKQRNADGLIVEVPDSYPVFTFKEDDSVFFSGGTVLNTIVKEWLAIYDGDLNACRQDFREEGGVRIKIEPGVLGKNGNEYTNIIVI